MEGLQAGDKEEGVREAKRDYDTAQDKLGSKKGRKPAFTCYR